MELNKYKSTCKECGTTVLPRMGEIEKIGGKWQTTCLLCISTMPVTETGCGYDMDMAYEDSCQAMCGL